MDMKVQGSRNGKALGIGELLASRAMLVLRWINHSIDIILSYEGSDKARGAVTYRS